MDLFEGAKKLSRWQQREIATFCGGVAMLLLVAGFIAGGGTARIGQSIAANNISPNSQTASVFPCSWSGSCPSSPGSWTMSFAPTSQTITAGQSATLYYQSYNCGPGGCAGDCYWSSMFIPGARAAPICTLNAGAPDTTYTTGVVVNNPSDLVNVGVGQIPYVVTPSLTTTYYFCSSLHAYTQGIGCQTSTVIVVAPTPVAPTVTIDAGAGPGVTRNVAVGTPVTINATFAPGAGDTITQTSIVDYQFNALPGISVAVPPTTKSYVFTPTAAGSYIFYPSVTTVTYPSWNNYGKSVMVTVNPAATPDACTDIPGTQGTPPSGCIGPIPSTPGSCIPTGGSYSSGTNTCSCPAGTTLQGNACVAGSPSCANGLANTYAPSCVCPAGQHQSGSLCVVNAPAVCANGLNSSYAPSCTCPAGQVQSGSVCVQQGSIVSFTANPSRVLKGNTATVSWSTTHMSSCSLSSLVSTGTTLVSLLLSSTVTPTINSKTIFTLTCSDASGASYSASATVNLIPQTIEK